MFCIFEISHVQGSLSGDSIPHLYYGLGNHFVCLTLLKVIGSENGIDKVGDILHNGEELKVKMPWHKVSDVQLAGACMSWVVCFALDTLRYCLLYTTIHSQSEIL